MRSMVEGACGGGASGESVAPSTTLLRRVVPLPRFAGQDEEGVRQRRRNLYVVIASEAKQSRAARARSWIASSLSLLAMTESFEW